MTESGYLKLNIGKRSELIKCYMRPKSIPQADEKSYTKIVMRLDKYTFYEAH